MKFVQLPLLLSAAAVCGLTLAIPAHAERKTPASEVKTLHEWAPLLSGTGGVVVDPLPNHATPDIVFWINGGTVDLSAVLRSGATHGKISVSVSGYPDGVYTVNAVTVSTGSAVTLGTLTVTTSSNAFPLNGVAIPQAVSSVLPVLNFSSGSAVFGGARNPFPGGFSPLDVASLTMSDSNGNLVSTATLTPVSQGYLTALSPLEAGSAAPGATGFAMLRANAMPLFLPVAASVISPPIIIDPLPPIYWHPKTGSLAIHGHGLPASTPVTYFLDDTQIGTATTDGSGNVIIYAGQGSHRKIPSSVNLFSVSSVTVEDGSGNVLVNAGF